MSKFPIKTAPQSSAEVPPRLAPLPNTALAFCDGACKSNPGRGGFGTVIILPEGEQIDICGGEAKTTNNRMELMGAIMALQHSPPDMPIQIWTDSGYVKDGITKWLANWKVKNWKKADGKPVLNQELWQQLDKHCQNRAISWHWLKGHAGHAGNEYADQLANLGVNNLPIPLTIKKKALAIDSNLSQNANTSIEKTAMNSNHPPVSNLNPLPTQPQTAAVSQSASDSFTDSFFIDEQFDSEDFDTHESSQSTLSTQQFDAPNLSSDGSIDTQAQMLVSSPLTQQPHFQNQPISAVNQTRVFHNEQGIFLAQDDTLISQRPDFDGNTQTASLFIPLLPLPKHKNVSNRQLLLDTETTGFDAVNGDRIIEIGIVELINRKFTGEKLHVYINPNKEMDEDVIRIHGITNAFLADKPVFAQVGQVVYDFMLGAELIAHNAPFDMGFLVAEFNRLGLADFANQVTVIDSLVIAKQQYAGQRNTLDALVKRLNVGKQDRTFHGALLDAEILAEVYLAMTGGQVSLAIDDSVGGLSGSGEHRRFDMPVARFVADDSAEQAHLDWLNALKSQNPALAERWGLAEKDDATVSAD